MFLCVSLNPAIDRRLKMDQLQVGKVNRVCQMREAPGGKALHVAMVLQTLGAAPLWLGFAGGTTGSMLIEGLRQMEIQAEGVPMRAKTRMNLEILEAGQRVTEILEPGPELSIGELEQFQNSYQRILAAGSTAGLLRDPHSRGSQISHQGFSGYERGAIALGACGRSRFCQTEPG